MSLFWNRSSSLPCRSSKSQSPGNIRKQWSVWLQNHRRFAASQHGFFYFIVGGADGVDTWAAEIVLEKKKTNPEINLELAKPFADYNKHLQNDYGRRLRAIEEAADRVTAVSDGADEAADYILRDCYMVDASERMIIVYDDDSKGPSGTKDALLYARSSGVEIRQIQWMHL